MLSAYESCGFMGERVIGFAYKCAQAHSHTRNPASARLPAPCMYTPNQGPLPKANRDTYTHTHTNKHTHTHTRARARAARLVPARSHTDYREMEEADLAQGLVMLGLISLVDPPRDGVLEAVERCRT